MPEEMREAEYRKQHRYERVARQPHGVGPELLAGRNGTAPTTVMKIQTEMIATTPPVSLFVGEGHPGSTAQASASNMRISAHIALAKTLRPLLPGVLVSRIPRPMVASLRIAFRQGLHRAPPKDFRWRGPCRDRDALTSGAPVLNPAHPKE